MLQRVRRKVTLLHCWKDCTLVNPLLKAVWGFLRKLKIELSYDPAISLQGMYLDKTIIQKDTSTPMFIAAVFKIAKTWKYCKHSSTDEWIKMMLYTHTHTHTVDYYSAIRMKQCHLEQHGCS